MKKIIIIIIIIYIFFNLTGCSTIKKLIGEKEELTNAEIVGIWYKYQWQPIFYKVSIDISKKYFFSNGYNLKKQQKKKRKKIYYIIKRKKEKRKLFYMLKKLKLRSEEEASRYFLLKLKEDSEKMKVEFYIPHFANTKWSLIVEPNIELGTQDPTQPFFEYVLENILYNIENIQGKIGIKIEW